MVARGVWGFSKGGAPAPHAALTFSKPTDDVRQARRKQDVWDSLAALGTGLCRIAVNQRCKIEFLFENLEIKHKLSVLKQRAPVDEQERAEQQPAAQQARNGLPRQQPGAQAADVLRSVVAH